MPLELGERLDVDSVSLRWAVTRDGEPRTLHVYGRLDRDALAEIEDDTRPWIGFEHASGVTIESVEAIGKELVIVTEDDRGPWLIAAARRLTDPIVREMWACAQIAAIGDVLAGAAAIMPSFVHGRIDDDALLVAADGLVRLQPLIRYDPLRTRNIGMARGIVHFRYHAISPEQAFGRPTTPASDVYQLALALYSAITLQRPFKRDSDFDTLQAIVRGPPIAAPTTTTPELAELVMRALSRDPAARPEHAAAFVAELRACAPCDAPPAAIEELVAWWPTMLRSNLGQGPGACARPWTQLAETKLDGIRTCRRCDRQVARTNSGAVLPLLEPCSGR